MTHRIFDDGNSRHNVPASFLQADDLFPTSHEYKGMTNANQPGEKDQAETGAAVRTGGSRQEHLGGEQSEADLP